MTGRAPRLLLVEDSVSQVEALEMILEHEGYVVHKALTLSSGKVLAGAHPPDLILVDVVMPDGDGTELVTWLREREKFVATPVILVSALPPQDRPPAPADAHVEFLQKPYTVEQLLDLLESMLNHSQEA